MKILRQSLTGVSAAALATMTCCTGKADAPDDALAASRRAMVDHQLVARQIRNPRVLEAMRTVPRHEFVPPALRDSAYADGPLPIGHDQTISQPFIVAFMTEALDPQPTDRVLEIGTGSGYQAAILAKLVAHVYSIEIIDPLAKQATATLGRLGFKNVTVKSGDGYRGWPEHAPFDAIIVTCAPENVPSALVDQLAEHGTMIIPVGAQHDVQQLYLLEKRDGKLTRTSILPVRFVPMTGAGDPKKGR